MATRQTHSLWHRLISAHELVYSKSILQPTLCNPFVLLNVHVYFLLALALHDNMKMIFLSFFHTSDFHIIQLPFQIATAVAELHKHVLCIQLPSYSCAVTFCKKIRFCTVVEAQKVTENCKTSLTLSYLIFWVSRISSISSHPHQPPAASNNKNK